MSTLTKPEVKGKNLSDNDYQAVVLYLISSEDKDLKELSGELKATQLLEVALSAFKQYCDHALQPDRHMNQYLNIFDKAIEIARGRQNKETGESILQPRDFSTIRDHMKARIAKWSKDQQAQIPEEIAGEIVGMRDFMEELVAQGISEKTPALKDAIRKLSIGLQGDQSQRLAGLSSGSGGRSKA